MPGVQIVTGSACDLSPDIAEERGVAIVPLSIRFGSEEFVDREELSTKEFWDRVITSGVIPETSAPSPGAFQRAFEQAASEGRPGVVCITLSSRLSATYQAACTAAATVADTIPVEVVDSLTVTVGQGLLVLGACDLAEGGTGVEEIRRRVEDSGKRTRVYGVIESLDFLKKGGRIGGAAHLVGSLLSIKPVVEVRDGVVEVESRQRTRRGSLQYLADKVKNAGKLERLGVAHGAAKDLDELVEMLGSARPEHEIVVTDLGPVIGSHAGPGTIGVSYELAG